MSSSRTRVDIVTGFLSSGKTSYINSLLVSREAGQGVVVIQAETGETWVEQGDPKVTVVEVNPGQTFLEVFHAVWERYSPSRVVYEHNGMQPLEQVLVDIEDDLAEVAFLGTVTHTVNAKGFEVLVRNIGTVMVEQMSHSDHIVINNTSTLASDELVAIKDKIASVNPRATIVFGGQDGLGPGHSVSSRRRGMPYRISALAFTLLAYGSIMVLLLGRFLFEPQTLKQLSTFNTIFLGILLEALPFILIGLLASSLLHVLIPSEGLVRVLPRNRYLAVVVASLAGLVFPICDCAAIPVAGRLIKKGVPAPAAVTFMMASPIVDPVVIMATLYAFPGKPQMALYRVLMGLTVAVGIGIILTVIGTNRSIVLDKLSVTACQCGFCGDDSNVAGAPVGFTGRVRGVFRHVETEFFGMMRFVIMGAAVSSLIHSFVPHSVLAGLGSSRVTALVIMMVLAYIMSMCSTSDAFVGKSFLGSFGLTGVMGFMIFGPMMDLKNTLIMLDLFDKKFVLLLITLAFSACFAAALLLTPILF